MQIRHVEHLSHPDLHFVRKCKIGNPLNDHDHADNAQKKVHFQPLFATLVVEN